MMASIIIMLISLGMRKAWREGQGQKGQVIGYGEISGYGEEGTTGQFDPIFIFGM